MAANAEVVGWEDGVLRPVDNSAGICGANWRVSYGDGDRESSAKSALLPAILLPEIDKQISGRG